MKKLLICLLTLALVLSGCHGKVEKGTFRVPESFDTSR